MSWRGREIINGRISSNCLSRRPRLTTHSTGARIGCFSCLSSAIELNALCRARLIRALGGLRSRVADASGWASEGASLDR